MRRRYAILPVAAVLAASASSPVAAKGPAPSSVASAAAPRHAAVQKQLDELAAWVKRSRGELTVEVRDLASGESVAAVNAHAALNPASNQKLITAIAALAELGPQHRFTTSVHGVLRNGAIGRLVIRGDGDPSLTTGDLWRIASSLKEQGLERVDQGIQVDQSAFDDRFVPPAFAQQPNEWAYFRAPVSAVALERNAVTVNVLPGKAGDNARVWFDPPGIVAASGRVATKPVGDGQSVSIQLKPGKSRLGASLSGSVAEGMPRLRFVKRVDDPRLSAGFALRHMLQRLGVKVNGGVTSGGANVRRRITYVRSRPLSVLLRALGKDSDNFYAEMVLKALGADPDAPASSERGAKRVLKWLKDNGLHDTGTRIENGSGLFDANRLSSSTICRALVHAHGDARIRPELLATLSIGGVDGTLRSRFRKYRHGRRIRAKTGTLAKVVSLSGYVQGGRSRAFSILVNGLSDHREVRRRIDRFVGSLVTPERR